MHFICSLTLQDHVIKKSGDFIGGGSLSYVTTLTDLVTIDISQDNTMCFFFYQIFFTYYKRTNRAVETGGEGGVKGGEKFLEQFFFYVKSENTKF